MTNEIKINYVSYLSADGTPWRVDITSTAFVDRADADALLARFPKSLKLRVTTCHHHHSANYSCGCDFCVANPGATKSHYLTQQATLISDKVNGGANETGIARIRKIKAACEKLGIAFGYKPTTVRNAAPIAWLESEVAPLATGAQVRILATRDGQPSSMINRIGVVVESPEGSEPLVKVGDEAPLWFRRNDVELVCGSCGAMLAPETGEPVYQLGGCAACSTRVRELEAVEVADCDSCAPESEVA